MDSTTLGFINVCLLVIHWCFSWPHSSFSVHSEVPWSCSQASLRSVTVLSQLTFSSFHRKHRRNFLHISLYFMYCFFLATIHRPAPPYLPYLPCPVPSLPYPAPPRPSTIPRLTIPSPALPLHHHHTSHSSLAAPPALPWGESSLCVPLWGVTNPRPRAG